MQANYFQPLEVGVVCDEPKKVLSATLWLQSALELRTKFTFGQQWGSMRYELHVFLQAGFSPYVSLTYIYQSRNWTSMFRILTATFDRLTAMYRV